uniref:Secreted protein n=1 Tax=Arundo donax TaxID=35708 RepID=A0A0A9AX88_ARUDO
MYCWVICFALMFGLLFMFTWHPLHAKTWAQSWYYGFHKKLRNPCLVDQKLNCRINDYIFLALLHFSLIVCSKSCQW